MSTWEHETGRLNALIAALPLEERTAAGPPESVLVDSWRRSQRSGVDLANVSAPYAGHAGADSALDAAARAELDEPGDDSEVSICVVDARMVVRVRGGEPPPFGRVLDELRLVPGFCVSEAHVGTTAMSLALVDGVECRLPGPQHFHPQLATFAEAAAMIRDEEGAVLGAVAVLAYRASSGDGLLSLARRLAAGIARRVAMRRDAAFAAVRAAFRGQEADGGRAIATDGDDVLLSGRLLTLPGEDVRALQDELLASFAVEEFHRRHVDLPSGSCVDADTCAVRIDGALVGAVLVVREVGSGTAPSEAARRQGAHAVPAVRRDFAADWARAHRSAEQTEGAIGSRELLSPFDRARREIAANIAGWRSHLLLGEQGVGKRTLVVEEFERAHPDGRVQLLDCSAPGWGTRAADAAIARAATEDRPRLLVLAKLAELTSVNARRLDELLSAHSGSALPPLVVGCLDEQDADSGRPYGLLIRRFHDAVRIPTLRARADEIAGLALDILRQDARGRSLRLSHQVIRVLEGYAWPGNVNELRDVIRYAIARKPVGEIQPSDLPAVCFSRTTHRLTALEAAQCDAIIQALYECRGNRYRAAEMLGIGRSSLYRKIDAFGISYIG
jgi:transcriptional regulator of acetoin/glycerol metabolism